MKNFFSNLGLKLTLLRIWFSKNLLLFFKTLLLVTAILIFTGCVGEDTFILGWIFYPIFRPIIDAINNLTSGAQTLMDVVGVTLSLISTIGIFSTKARNIAISDIKSEKLKLAIIKADLYFDANGKLTRKPDHIEDTEIGEVKIAKDETIVAGIKRAADEFITVVSAKLPEEEQEMVTEKEELECCSINEASENGKEAILLTSELAATEVSEINNEVKDAVKKLEDKNLTADEKVSVLRKLVKAIKKGLKKVGYGICLCFKTIGRGLKKFGCAIASIFRKKKKCNHSNNETAENVQDVKVISEGVSVEIENDDPAPKAETKEITENKIEENNVAEEKVEAAAPSTTKPVGSGDDFLARLKSISRK